MIRWFAPAAFALAIGLMVLVRPPSADRPKASPRANALDLLVLGDRPVRLELHVEIDGTSIPAMWDKTFARLHAFHDRNGDGVLDRTEAGRLPESFVLRQGLWGPFSPYAGIAPPLADVDRNGDDAVDGGELADFYRRAGLGGVLVGVGKPTATEKLTDALLKHLDTNGDGHLTAAEWKVASTTLLKIDGNGDELVGPGELVAKLAYPGATGANLLVPPDPAARPDPVTDTLPLIALPLRTANTAWAGVVARRIATMEKPITAEDLLALRREPPKVAWQVSLGAKRTTLAPVGGKEPASGRLLFAAPTLRLELRADAGILTDQTAAARKRFTTLFAECDGDGDGRLDAKESGAAKAALLKQLLAVADRDDDGKLDARELATWLDLQEQIARGHVLLTVLNHGTGLFELLDADHDGSLSVRELRAAWDRLKATGCVHDQQFVRAKLPSQLIAALGHGHPQSTLARPIRSGPEWYRAMDRNGDGDVSAKEWVGDLGTFLKLDVDGDRLLSTEEAARAAN